MVVLRAQSGDRRSDRERIRCTGACLEACVSGEGRGEASGPARYQGILKLCNAVAGERGSAQRFAAAFEGDCPGGCAIRVCGRSAVAVGLRIDKKDESVIRSGRSLARGWVVVACNLQGRSAAFGANRDGNCVGIAGRKGSAPAVMCSDVVSSARKGIGGAGSGPSVQRKV